MASLLQCHQQTVQRLLSEAITVLCQNSLPFRDHLCIQGLLGITLDNRDVLLVDIHERVSRSGFEHWEDENDRYANPMTQIHKLTPEGLMGKLTPEGLMANSHMYNNSVNNSHNAQRMAPDSPAAMAILNKMYERQLASFKSELYNNKLSPNEERHRMEREMERRNGETRMERPELRPEHRGEHKDRMDDRLPERQTRPENLHQDRALSLDRPLDRPLERLDRLDRPLDRPQDSDRERQEEKDLSNGARKEGLVNGHASPRSPLSPRDPREGREIRESPKGPEMISNSGSTLGSSTPSSSKILTKSCLPKDDQELISPPRSPNQPTNDTPEDQSLRDKDSISLTVSKIFAQRYEGQPPLKKRLALAEMDAEQEIEDSQDSEETPLNYTLCHTVKGKLRGSQKRKARVSYPLDLSKVGQYDPDQRDNEDDLAEWGVTDKEQSSEEDSTSPRRDSPPSRHAHTPNSATPPTAETTADQAYDDHKEVANSQPHFNSMMRGSLPPIPVSMFEGSPLGGSGDMGLSLMINNLVNVYAPGLPLSGLGKPPDLSPVGYSGKSPGLMGGSPQHSPLLSPSPGHASPHTLPPGTPTGLGDERGHKCSQCGKLVASLQGLMIHYRTHTGEKPHICGMCGKGLSTVQGLQVHQRTHTGEKPYVCTTCGKGFNDKSNMKRHIRHCTLRAPTRFLLSNPLHMSHS